MLNLNMAMKIWISKFCEKVEKIQLSPAVENTRRGKG